MLGQFIGMKPDEFDIYLSPPETNGHELAYVEEAFRDGWLAPNGRFVYQLEERLKALLLCNHAVAVNTGTSALHLALMLLGVERGDYVICPSFTFVASANPILYQGAFPVFVDANKDHWNLDPAALETCLKDLQRQHKQPKAIVFTSIFGNTQGIEEVAAIAQKYETPLIEDASQSLGASLNGVMAGTFGDFGVFSMNGNKVITATAGGMLVFKDEAYERKARQLINQAKEDRPYYYHTQVGYNYAMSNVNAAIAYGQMEDLDKRIRRKHAIFQAYLSFFEERGMPCSYQDIFPDNVNTYWLSSFVLPSVNIPGLRKEFFENRIQVGHFYYPLHLQPVFKGCPIYGAGNSLTLFEQGISLPSGVGLQEKGIKRVLNVFA